MSAPLDVEAATAAYLAKGGRITKLPMARRPLRFSDPELANLTEDQLKIFRKLKANGIGREEAIRVARQP